MSKYVVIALLLAGCSTTTHNQKEAICHRWLESIPTYVEKDTEETKRTVKVNQDTYVAICEV